MDAEAKKFLGRLWADDAPGNREDPAYSLLDRNRYNVPSRLQGWDNDYSTQGTGRFPERKIFNQLVRELQGGFQEHMYYGFPRWANDVDFPRFAFVLYDGKIWRAEVSTGPSSRNSAAPGTDSSVWSRL